MDMKTVVLLVLVTLFEMEGLASALDAHQLRQLAAKHNVTSILVFGDSSVDPGNNNFLPTDMKGNFPPYGKNFQHGRPTGRLSDGKLATDFIAELIGNPSVPAFLDRTLTPTDLLHGVSFASAGSGYDDLTANFSDVFSFPDQVKYFLHYKLHLNRLVGPLESQKIINKAIFVLSMGTNDFLQNYFVEDVRQRQFSVPQYIDFLSSHMFNDAKMLHRLGARRIVVVGVPPMGCMPLMKTLRSQDHCVEQLNRMAFSFNSKIKNNLSSLRSRFGLKSAYIDAYSSILKAIANPKSYGLIETSKGCCGTGTYEYGVTCKGMQACTDPSKYVFWDAVHPTQKMYQIIVRQGIATIAEDFLI
ncbi:PREDICTED: GDSL esterase/lipase At5g45950 [Tarenaya hassleriana]|uniref:GDSL esterase/lipase At5g45950 n=1 Tax=Tarenaya hassleriana TaxID=28532 RepID=UPI00053C99D1|nr:PREDICTED: GDSL esterase/lipase At5g45950 [Tarenaya hassleriana]